MNEIILYSPMDMHLHLREKEILKSVLPFSTKQFAVALVMPNLSKPITTVSMALTYKDEILALCEKESFLPIMSLYFQEDFDEELLKSAFSAGIKIIKLYPKGVTTNSQSGIDTIFTKKTQRVFKIMQDIGMILSIHGETSDFVLDREKNFLPIYIRLSKEFPKLKIIMEHITCKETTKVLKDYENLYATITLHHLLITLDDVIGGSLNPHNFCKPIAKTKEDKEALLELALNANKKVSFGSDSAPHLIKNKESSMGAAGIFSAPILLPLLVELFEKHNKLSNLQDFISNNARAIYEIEPPKKEVKLIKKEMIVPQEIDGIKPFMAKSTISWSLKTKE